MTACDQKSATLWTSSYTRYSSSYCLSPSVQPKGRPDRGAPSAPQQKPLVYFISPDVCTPLPKNETP
eukprot:scaffold16764_cov56-Cylindrotheca_fusiformis.AAC.1